LASRHKPSPVHHSNLMKSPRQPLNTNTWPLNGSFLQRHLHFGLQPIEATAHVGGAIW
jgi:hypothetical protein